MSEHEEQFVFQMGYNKGFKDGIKGSIPKADYEARLKADMVAMLEEISLKFDEQYYVNRHQLHDDSLNRGLEQGQDIIQEKIKALKEKEDE